MNVKDITLRAIKRQRERQNFWVLIKSWKDERLLPEREMFKVLVHGPPKTWKTNICERLRLYWPNCIPVELTGQARFEQIAGYPLVIHTHRHVTVHQELSCDWECVTVDKSRYFGLESVRSDYDGQTQPRFYDLVPIRPAFQ